MFVENLIVTIRYCGCCSDGTEYYKITAKTKEDLTRILSRFPTEKVSKSYCPSNDPILPSVLIECLLASKSFSAAAATINANMRKTENEINKLKRSQEDIPYKCKDGYTLTVKQIKENDRYVKSFSAAILSLGCLLKEQEDSYNEIFKVDPESVYEKVYDSDIFPEEE